MLYERFSEIIYKHLIKLHKSPSWLSQRLGVNRSTVNRWINGTTRPNSPETLIRIADLLGIHDLAERQELLASVGYGLDIKYIEPVSDTVNSPNSKSPGNDLVLSEIHEASAFLIKSRRFLWSEK